MDRFSGFRQFSHLQGIAFFGLILGSSLGLSQNETGFLKVPEARSPSSVRCEAVLNSSKNQAAEGPHFWAIGPEMIPLIEKHVSESRRLSPSVDDIETSRNVERFVREQPGLTISLLNRRFWAELDRVPRVFAQKGFVVGDPHDGNFGFRFRFYPQDARDDRFDYGLKDFDEAGIGLFTVDFTRYLVYLMAAHKNLDKFGRDFLDQVIDSYLQGLALDESRPVPNLIRKELVKNQQRVREKIRSYAQDKLTEEMKFTSETLANTLAEFRFRNLEAGFVSPLRITNDDPPSEGEKEQIKAQIRDEIHSSIRNHFGQLNVVIYDVAIAKRTSGGSQGLQRFWISAQVKDSDGNWLPMIIELKQNSSRSGWTDAFRNELRSSSEARYGFALNTANSRRGHSQAVVRIGKSDFLLRIKGTPDVEPRNTSEEAEMILYNSYQMGLIHGSQGTRVSAPFNQAVQSDTQAFRDFVTDLARSVYRELQRIHND